MHCHLNRNQSQKYKVLPTLLSHKIHLFGPLGHFTDPNDRFPYPFIYLKPEKDTPFGGASPYRPLQEVPPSPRLLHQGKPTIWALIYTEVKFY